MIGAALARVAPDLGPAARKLRDRRAAGNRPVMTTVALTVNGERVQALVEPRTHLADFLREQRA